MEAPFASVQDLRDRWPDFPAGGDDHAMTLLEDASQFILDSVPSAMSASPSTLRRVTCSVVRRSMESGHQPGVDQWSVTTGPFTESARPVNPHGDFYLTKAEKFALGQGKQRAFGVQIGCFGPGPHRPWCSLAWGAYCSCGADLTLEEPLWEA